MNIAAKLYNQVTNHYFELRRNGDDLILEPMPFSRKLPHVLVQSLKDHKPELLSLLLFMEEADALLLDSTRRIARAWPPGFDLDADPRWQQADRELHHAYHSGDMKKLEIILELGERLALKLFDAHRKEAAA